ASGSNHWLALKADGTVYSKTWNGSQFLAGQVAGLSGIVQIAAYESVDIALAPGGLVWAWGNGAIGDGTTGLVRSTPVSLCAANFAWRTATPTLSPGTGTYGLNQSVQVNNTMAGATIYYTKDGSDPADTTNPNRYQIASGQSFTLNASATVKAQAF